MGYNEFAIQEARYAFMEYMTISEAAKVWGISSRRVQQLCKEGAIAGAKKEGRSWLIPADTQMTVSTKAGNRRQLLPLPVGISS